MLASNDIASNALLKDRKIENVDYGQKGRRADQDRRLRRQRRDLTSNDVDVGDWPELTKTWPLKARRLVPSGPMMRAPLGAIKNGRQTTL
jgi:hypothetical protein